MFAFLAVALALAPVDSPPPVPPGASLSAYAWGKAPAALHRDFLTAFNKDMGSGMELLAQHDAQLQVGMKACLPQRVIPELWSQGALASQAIQEGASAGLATSRGVTRGQLDAAWIAAPAAARDCTRANASKVFFSPPRGACADLSAPTWFIKHFSVPEADSADATRLLYYFNAKAQSEWVDGLLLHLQATPAKAS